MSKKKPSRPKRARSMSRRGRHIVIAAVVVLSLFASWTLLAYSGALDPLLKQGETRRRSKYRASTRTARRRNTSTQARNSSRPKKDPRARADPVLARSSTLNPIQRARSRSTGTACGEY